MNIYNNLGKTILDFFVVVLSVVILSPVIILLIIVVYLFMGSPVFFLQDRPGKNGKNFSIIKFRTMSNKIGSDGKLLSDAQRLTSVGIFFRKTSLDELPELLNVLKGDMSLVGPRPLLMEYLDRYSPEQARRHEVKPGITGWAQVNGRNALSWEEKFKLDVWYVDNMSFWLDIKILFMTIIQVFTQRGINAEGHATMPEFMGTKIDDP